ncbi:MAG: hypothetical protein HZA53_01995 [Planctomycetes bacterium]|nr:hypothetical protein [Planctomycetota bacterium]
MLTDPTPHPFRSLPIRREFLVAAASALVLGGVARRPVELGDADEDAEATPLDLTRFLALGNTLAGRLVVDRSPLGQDRYLHALAALAVRLAGVPVPAMKEQAAPGYSLGFHEGGVPFTVLHWKLAPGAAIREHPHTYGNVVTLVLEGDVRIRNYELVGERDYEARGMFRVQRTCEAFLRPGGTNLVSLERNYVHGFLAGPNGARGLDITTRIRERRETPVLEIAAKPVDEAHGLYEASWKSGG